MITPADLLAILPNAGRRAELMADPLNAAMDEFEINTPARQAAFIAQIGHESGQFRYMEELASGAAYEGRKDLGNTKPEAVAIAAANGTTPGRWWKGHGPIQITGYDNHLACGTALGLDLLNSPRLITEPEDGCRSAGWFWQSHGLNELADAGNFERITRRINGGLNGQAERLEFYERAKAVLA